MLLPTDDGVRHINVYSKSATPLGRFLSNFTRKWIDVPCPDGQTRAFASVEALWYWLGVSHHPNEAQLRGTSGYAAKHLGRQMKRDVGTRHVDGFEAIICQAIRLKVDATPRARRALADSTLPFAHYYVMQGRVMDVSGKYPWLLELFDTLREECRADPADRPHARHRR